ncbi:hypothetical protein EPUS_06261 [Endocarpon pusillum Z07020]|uniref:Rhamnolipids biosynthesis 3-oxoacyl-[acyl-carrier-protein] reductase n=1 Tax=Endocarpon pusillum (strain Z07020 / HMAS-L-300199) TaxID=1263415 RepID=U1FVG7_ENDPU|nr:uncharacterized protein EPUS_06261 [Endocarpon pusillum Z07020]ERF68817.1 hypothetical protein EPUS_06261 [Endocarpon pusillum Z07020]
MSAEADVKLQDFENIFKLDGKVAVVTGGSRGLGLHAASGLLQAGCSQVYITSRKASGCEQAVLALNALPNKQPHAVAISVPADLSKVSEIERLAAEIGKQTPHIDILFANAGATWGERFETHPEPAFSKVMDLNVKSVFYTIQKLEPLLPARAPAAAIHLTKNLAVELAPRHILCNAIAPGFYPSKMANGLMELEGGEEKLAQMSPNQRLGHPEDVAGLVVFLASRAAAHLNGTVIATDGGAVLARGRL